MTSILNLETIHRSLSLLTPLTPPAWGRMTAQHMVEHLIQTLRLSNGKKNLTELFIPAEKLPRYYAFLLSDQPFPRNLVRPVSEQQSLPLLQYADIQAALIALEQELEAFRIYFAKQPAAKLLHPFFGELNYLE